ncbi:MAG: hypothetical protein JWN22_3377 [Nocardioides sp.]|jgi:hypothetical protein|nr:hypothetical protein [Nocardioides sp.]
MSTTTPAPPTTVALPAGFEWLGRYAKWALDGERARIEARLTTPIEESRLFYASVLAEVPAIMAHLLGCPVDDVSEADENLLRIMLSYVEVSNAVEIYEQAEVPDGADLRLFVSVLEGTR